MNATGYDCLYCNRNNTFGQFVYDHWNAPVVHTCACGARSEILRGQASLIYTPRKAHRPHRQGDENFCPDCGKRWGLNDPEPPECRK